MKIKKWITVIFTVVCLSCVLAFGAACVGGNDSSSDSSSEQTGGKTTAIVKFDVNTEYTTNVLSDKEITVGRRVSQPKLFILDENPDNLQVYGWYTSKNCEESTKWDFKNGKVSEDMTLYAKWVELYDVNYYVNGVFDSTVNAFRGDCIEESAELVKGYKYLGSYQDKAHSKKFDFDTPISGDTDVYVSRSLGLYLSDSVEEGLLSSGNLTNYLTAACGSPDPENGTEEGWVEKYTIASTGEKCTYVNFGLNPNYGDGYVELSLALDITQSQIIRLTYKNLGPAKTINCYFTAMLDEKTYSETGAAYNSNFNWPNYMGGPVGEPLTIPYEMEEDDEWATVDFNLYEVYKNGYSIWGTSLYLGSLRIEVGYKNVDKDDWSNEMLIKSIEGVPYEIAVEDSGEINALRVDAPAIQLENAAAALPENTNGISFVKDREGLYKITGNAEVYKTTEGMLFYAENEILARENKGDTTGFSVNVPEGRTVSLDELTTLHLTLQNYGYATDLIIYVYNDEGIPVKATLEMNTRMSESKTYTINMYGLFGMKGTLKRVEFVYSSVGVDNLILFNDVTFGDFVPYDIVGLNFNDKYCFGMRSTDDIAVSFEGDLKGTMFEVGKNGASVTSPEKAYDATNEGYENMTLHYNLPQDSSITAVKVELKINGSFGTPYVYALDVEKKGVGSVTLPFVKNERGFVKAVRFTFEGVGAIVINELAYSVNESSLPFYDSYHLVYNSGHPDWKGIHNYYEYDSKSQSSNFIKGDSEAYLGASIYIGFSAYEPYLAAPHTTKNVPVTGKTTITLVYQNRTSIADMAIHCSFDKNDHDPGDGSPYPIWRNYGIAIDSNMEEYEWSAVSIVLEGEDLETYINTYLAKVMFEFFGDELTIRAITIEVEA